MKNTGAKTYHFTDVAAHHARAHRRHMGTTPHQSKSGATMSPGAIVFQVAMPGAGLQPTTPPITTAHQRTAYAMGYVATAETRRACAQISAAGPQTQTTAATKPQWRTGQAGGRRLHPSATSSAISENSTTGTQKRASVRTKGHSRLRYIIMSHTICSFTCRGVWRHEAFGVGGISNSGGGSVEPQHMSMRQGRLKEANQ